MPDNYILLKSNCKKILLLFFCLIGTVDLNADEIRFEAEDALLQGLTVITTLKGYSGSGYVTGFDNDSDRLTFNIDAENKLYELKIGYTTPYGQKGYELTVNGIKTSGMLASSIGVFAEHDAGKFQLNEGLNSIIIGKGWGWYDVDYIRLVNTSVTPPLKPSSPLIDEDASASTKALYNFLIQQYGEKILSGQQDLSDINYIKSVTGKSPAIGVFDLMDYSPSRIQHGANPGNSCETWINWAKNNNAIVSLSWHWNAPTDLIDAAGKEWWRGFYTDATTFNLQSALADTNSSRYKLLLSDIDAIAIQLKKFSDADVPVLWRPLHEASGGWFWWGAKGSAPYKALWKLMFHRLTDYHDLHNLIWVSTHGDDAWYVGHEYADIVGLDIYTDQSSNMSGEWEASKKNYDGTKLIALSESGTLPKPYEVSYFATWWSWFSVWSGDFIRKADKNLLKEVYNDDIVITLDELPDWRSITGLEGFSSTAIENEIALDLYPNPANPTTNIVFNIPQSSGVILTVYNLLGREIFSYNYGELAEGSYTCRFDGSDLSSGFYIARIIADGFMLNKKFILLK